MSIHAPQPANVLVRRLAPHDRITIRGVVYHRPEPVVNGYCLTRKEDSEPEVFTHEDLERFDRQDELTIDHEYFRYRHTYAGDPRYVDVTSIDVLAPLKRFEVRRRLLIVLEVEGRVAAGQRILSEAALQPIIDELFEDGTPFRKQLDGFAKARDRATNSVPAASNADFARTIGAQDKDRYREPPAARTVLQWFRRWRISGRNVLVLAGDYSRVGAKKIILHPKVQQHVDNALGVREFAETMANRYETAKLAILADNRLIEEQNKRRLEIGEELIPLLEVPTQYLFRREAKKLGAFRKMICSKGLPAATRAFTALGAGLDMRALGERVEMDCWECNLKVILEHAELFDLLSPAARRDAERLKVWLVFAIDCASRVVLGIAFSLSSNVDAVLNARAQIGMDKTGIARSVGCRSPWNHRTGVQLLVADNGNEFTPLVAVTAEGALGEAAKAATPAAMPQMKGTCERLFARCAARFQGTPGWTEFRQRLNKDFKPEKHAQLVLDEMVQLLIRFTVDVYHNSAHRGLGGQRPAEAWDELYEKRNIHPIASPSRRRVAFGVSVSRVVGRHGVTVLGIDYQCEAIQTHFRDAGNVKVDVFVDPKDLGAVSVRIGQEFHVARPRRNVQLHGVSMDALIEARRTLRAKYDADLQLRESIVNDALAASRALFARTAYRATVVIKPLDGSRLDAEEQKLGIALQIEADASADPGTPDHTFGVELEAFPVNAGTPDPAPQSTTTSGRAPRAGTRFGKAGAS